MEIEYLQNNDLGKKVFSVSEYIDLLNDKLKSFAVKIIGEISEIKFGPTGHAYFKLKDKKDESVIDCVIWKRQYDFYGIELKKGIEIIATGHSNVHSQYGFKFVAGVIAYAGEGILKQEYDKLKKKLTEEGLFSEEKKRPIPEYVQRVGIITSKTGAVIHDFTANLGKFGFQVKMIDSRVEGQDAVEDLLLSLDLSKKQNIEVLVIMRGGGSLEALSAFNNERIIREVANFPVPVIAAIGHEKDVPLMSLASDAMVSTASIAAHLLSESWEKAQFKLARSENNILNLYDNNLSEAGNLLNEFFYKIQIEFSSILGRYGESENKLKTFFHAISNQLISRKKEVANISNSIIKDFSSRLKNLYYKIEGVDFYYNFRDSIMLGKRNIVDASRSILRNFSSNLNSADNKILHTESVIGSNNPERQLKIGYSIARYNGGIIKTVKNINIGEDMEVQVFDGSIKSKIKNINKK